MVTDVTESLKQVGRYLTIRTCVYKRLRILKIESHRIAFHGIEASTCWHTLCKYRPFALDLLVLY
jgi:hypothetical protein